MKHKKNIKKMKKTVKNVAIMATTIIITTGIITAIQTNIGSIIAASILLFSGILGCAAGCILPFVKQEG
jgi:4-hydroxybenzoate polyprenyltransferase